MKPAFQPHERRQFGRRRTQLHAWVRVPGRPQYPCIVRDLSEGGAKLEFDDTSWLPARFHLTIDADGFESDCEVRHQDATHAGVEFVKRRPALVAGHGG